MASDQTYIICIKTSIIVRLLLFVGIAYAQDHSNTEHLPKVFLDCDDCDMDYLKRQINFVNYVRDRKLADIHVLVTEQGTASGGEAYKMNFIGLDQFKAIDFTLLYNAPTIATELERDQGMAQKIKTGLIPFLSETPFFEKIIVDVQQPNDTTSRINDNSNDPWNFWIFEVSMGGFFETEERQRNFSLDAEISANRVTDAWRIRNNIDLDIDREAFETDDGTVIRFNEEYVYEGSIVKSFTQHWSAGIFGTCLSNTFQNTDFGIRFSPAIEWNYFPYSISDRKELTVAYKIGGRYNDYIDTTFFDQKKETLMEHSLDISYDVSQPWGGVELGIEGSNYFNDLRKHRLEFDAECSIRLVKGLSFNIGGKIQFIHDQIHLPKEGASREDILLKRRELTTAYHYEGEIGFSYVFGSIYNNIVNNRL